MIAANIIICHLKQTCFGDDAIVTVKPRIRNEKLGSYNSIKRAQYIVIITNVDNCIMILHDERKERECNGGKTDSIR